MAAHLEEPSEEIRRLRHCLNDLVGLVALPAMWAGADSLQIVRTLLDALLRMLRLDFVYARWRDPASAEPVEIARVAESWQPISQPQDIGRMLFRELGDDPQKWAPLTRGSSGGVSIVPLRLGMYGELGLIVAGSERVGFPEQAETLVLNVAANQASIGLQETRLLGEQKRLTNELDRRIAQRTAELAATNEELRREISERMRVEEALRHSEAFLAEGQRLSRVGSFSWRTPTDEIICSEQMYRIFELEALMAVTIRLMSARIHPEDQSSFAAVVERARAAATDVEHEFRLLMSDGSVKHLYLIAHGGRDKNDQLEYIGAIQDVTERRLAEEALAELQSELARVARITSLGILTASMAHEVNQPLSGIITNASTCLRMLSADPPNVDGALETARRTIRDGTRASEVVTRLRTLYSKKELSPESMDLNDAAREVISLSLSELQRNRIVLRQELAESLPPVIGDRVQLQQVMLNLVRNASDAMSTVEGRPRELLIATEHEDDSRVCLRVKDSGVGFEPKSVNRLFEAFYTTKNDGMGIGLSMSRSIIEAHQGRLWATQNQGPGATFSFSIPCGANTKV